jgi:hypothetical protein
VKIGVIGVRLGSYWTYRGVVVLFVGLDGSIITMVQSAMIVRGIQIANTTVNIGVRIV